MPVSVHGVPWALPFVALLLAIALLPVLRPGLWHHRQGSIAAACALAFLLPSAWPHGPGWTAHLALHALLREYLPFLLLLLTALYTIGGDALTPLGIFLSIIPVLAMLRAGLHGPLAPLVRLACDAAGRPLPDLYFRLTGGLSSLLDNAPTYLVFFNLAGGDAATLMREASVPGAIAGGAVCMGAMTYIGNAPNLMVRAIARQRGVDMPGFFGCVAWSSAVMLPCLVPVQRLFWP